MIKADSINFGQHSPILRKKPENLSTEYIFLNEGNNIRLTTATDKKQALSDICHALGLNYQSNILFPDKICSKVKSPTNHSYALLHQHLDTCHGILNKTNDLQSNTPRLMKYLKSSTIQLFQKLIPNNNETIEKLAHQFLFLVAHRDGQSHNSLPTRAGILKDFLEENLKADQKLNTSESNTIHIPRNIGKIFDEHVKKYFNKVDNQITRFKYYNDSKSFLNASTCSNIKDKENSGGRFIWAELHGERKQHSDGYGKTYRDTRVFEQKYSEDNTGKFKSGKLELYITPENINEYWRRVQIGVSLGLISLAKVSIIKNVDGTTYEDAEEKNQGKHCLMVYVEDFTDQQQVSSMFNNLLKLGIIPENDDQIIRFKPDLYTQANMYGKGSYYDCAEIMQLTQEEYQGFVGKVNSTYEQNQLTQEKYQKFGEKVNNDSSSGEELK